MSDVAKNDGAPEGVAPEPLPLTKPAANRFADDVREAKKRDKELRRQRRMANGDRPQRAAGSLKPFMDVARQKWAGNAKAQGAMFMSMSLVPAAIGPERAIGHKRRKEWGRVLKELPDQLDLAGAPINNLDEIGPKHVAPLVKLWEEMGHSEGYIADLLSILRRFLALIGKPSAVPTGPRLHEHLHSKGIVAGTIGRSAVAIMPKGWRDMGHDPKAIIAQVAEYSPLMAVHLELMEAFGLRCKECYMLMPEESDKGEYLWVWRGAKGKRHRTVPFSRIPEKAAWQREVLDRAKKLAAKNFKGELSENGLTNKQMERRQRYVFTKFNITLDSEKGLVPHGLRHQFATDLFKDLSGLPAPVLGLVAAEEYKKKWLIVHEATLEVSRQLGHERKSVTAAYAGSAPKLKTHQRKRLNAWLSASRAADPVLDSSGVSGCWILGRAAKGLELAPGERMQVAIRFEGHAELTMASVSGRMEAVRAALEEALSSRVTLTVWVEEGSPPEAAATMFSPQAASKLRSTSDK